MEMILKILFLEDVISDFQLICHEIKSSKIPYEKLLVENRKDFLEGLKSFNPDLIISDYSLPLINGMSALQLRNKLAPSTQFILITGTLNEEVAVECMKAGADDYILKDNLSRLGPAILNAIKKFELLRQKNDAQEAVRQSYEFSNSLTKTIPFGMDIVDMKGTVLFQSDNFKRIFGIDAIGEKCWNLYRVDKKQCDDCPLLRGVNVGETEIFESHGVLGNRIFEISHTGMMYQGKKAMLEIFQDITERIEKDEELLRAKKQAEESEKRLLRLNVDKDRFMSILGHDLRSPFTTLLGLSGILNENIQEFDVDEIKNMASEINITAQSTFNLLEDILMWARTQQGKIPFNPQQLSLTEICNNILETLNSNVNAKNITINYSAIENLNVYADEDMLKTVLRNLVSNAIKFTNNGGAIYINAKQTDSNTTISVSDNGVGISHDNKAKLFDVGQVLTTKGTAEETGTGLGLLLCKEFVEKHDGKIWVESEEGKGSEFKFTLPSPGLNL
jgi:signal transduction histidine kinase/CheY-like chemotaxis protein